VPGAGNQQERPSIGTIPVPLGSFLSGFALGEASFMIVCRKRGDHRRGWRLSAAFNVSQIDRAPLDLFREALGCGTFRRAGSGGWYLEVNRLRDLQLTVVPFFRRFPLVGTKAEDFELWSDAVALLSRPGGPLGSGLPRGSCSSRKNEPRRKEATPDGRNPQRLYAELRA